MSQITEKIRARNSKKTSDSLLSKSNYLVPFLGTGFLSFLDFLIGFNIAIILAIAGSYLSKVSGLDCDSIYSFLFNSSTLFR